MFTATAYAQTQTPAESPKGPSALESFLPIIILFVAMYFFFIRPQAKKQKEHQKFVSELKRGDEVVTASGILGRVYAIADSLVTLEIAQGVQVKMLRSQISGPSQTVPEIKK